MLTHLRLCIPFYDSTPHKYRDIVLPLSFHNIVRSSQKMKIADDETSFFKDFTRGASFEGFAEFEVAAGEGPGALNSLRIYTTKIELGKKGPWGNYLPTPWLPFLLPRTNFVPSWLNTNTPTPTLAFIFMMIVTRGDS
jgi:hypothetical protein